MSAAGAERPSSPAACPTWCVCTSTSSLRSLSSLCCSTQKVCLSFKHIVEKRQRFLVLINGALHCQMNLSHIQLKYFSVAERCHVRYPAPFLCPSLFASHSAVDLIPASNGLRSLNCSSIEGFQLFIFYRRGSALAATTICIVYS